MGLFIAALGFGVKYGLAWYTNHGEGIEVPNMVKMSSSDARLLLEEKNLGLVVTDSGYNKLLPANCILAQSPGAGTKVKAGRVVYVTVNSTSSPMVVIPDVIDNSSYREAEAKLLALGFKLLPPKRIVGEKDWVYGIICRGRLLNSGDRVSIDSPLMLQVGSGTYSDDEDIEYTDPAELFGNDGMGGHVDLGDMEEELKNIKVDESGLNDF